MNFNIDKLRTFIVVATKGTLSAAAKELNASQPNIGRQMVDLEKEVGLCLFVRHSRGIDLTCQGKDFFNLCKDVRGTLSQGLDTIREKETTPEGKLKVISGSGMLGKILKNISLFSKKYPNISFDFSSIVNIYHLEIGDSDIAIMVDKIDETDFIQQHLYDMHMRIYASPIYIDQYGYPKNLEDLQSHKLILYTGENQDTLNEQFKIKSKNNILNPIMIIRNGPAMYDSLLSGIGMGCYTYDKELIEKNLLVDIFPEMPSQIIPYYYTYHRRMEKSPKIHAFYDFLKEEVVNIWNPNN